MTSFFKGTTRKMKHRLNIYNNPANFDPQGAELEAAKVAVVPKTAEEKALLTASLSTHYVFSHLQPKDLESVMDRMAKLTFSTPETVVIEQGESGDMFYVLAAGSADIFVDGAKVGSYERPGETFGELALLYSAKRAATIKTGSAAAAAKGGQKTELWSLDAKTFHRLAIKRNKHATRGRVDFLKKVPLLRHVNPTLLAKIADALTEVTYLKGQRIITEGEVGDDFFLVQEGYVKCTHSDQDLLELGPGDYFGEMALMLDEPRHANVDATSAKTVCFKISRFDFVRLFGDLKDLLQQQMRIRILKSVPLLRNSGLADDVLDKLADAMRIQLFRPRKHIIKQGDEGHRFYIINDGTAKVSTVRAGEDGDVEEVLKTLGPQDFFGEKSLINDEPHDVTVTAETHLECLVLDRESFRAYLADVDAVKRERKRKAAKAAAAGKSSGGAAASQGNNAAAGTAANGALLQQKRPLAKDLQRFKTLGTGTFGRVALVVHSVTRDVYALKQMQKSQIVQSHQERNIMNEKNLLLACSHPNVLGLVATYQDADCLYMLMELVQGGELWSLVYEKARETAPLRKRGFGCFDEPTTAFYLGCVAAAFEHIHGHGIAYRDLKPENLLVDKAGYLKVIDFGFAKQVPWTDPKTNAYHDKSYTICGTPEYLCPEIIQSKGHDKAVDYWALGCLAFELLVGRTPFADDRQPEIFRKILNSKKLLGSSGGGSDHSKAAAASAQVWPKQFPERAKHLVQNLCKHEAPFRLGMSQKNGINDIKAHPFFAGFDFDALKARQLKAPYVPKIADAVDTSNFDPYDEEDTVAKFRGQQAPFKDWSDMGADFPPPKH